MISVDSCPNVILGWAFFTQWHLCEALTNFFLLHFRPVSVQLAEEVTGHDWLVLSFVKMFFRISINGGTPNMDSL